MKYIYTAEDCPRCETLKDEYKSKGVEYTERDAERLKSPTHDRDEIDVDAFVQLSMQNMVLPVEIEA